MQDQSRFDAFDAFGVACMQATALVETAAIKFFHVIANIFLYMIFRRTHARLPINQYRKQGTHVCKASG